MLELLAQKCEYADAEAAQLFRQGGPLVGKLHRSGNGTPMAQGAKYDLQLLLDERHERNLQIIASLRKDKNSKELLKNAVDDLKLGRISRVLDAESIDLGSISVSPRFGVEQGMGRCARACQCLAQALRL